MINSHSSRLRVGAASLFLVILAGCGSSATTSSPAGSAGGSPQPAAERSISFGDGKVAQPYDDVLNAAFADLKTFWAANYEPTYGSPFTPVAAIYALYPERTDPVVGCSGPVAYSEVKGNAFYTSCGDIIVYDDSELVPDLTKRMGVASVAVVAAHEYGHAIQARAGVYSIPGIKTIDTEQQADCFAGAWTAHVARGEAPALAFGDADVKAGIDAMIDVADTPGTDSENDDSGHGSAFDRVGAFEEGFINGVARCKDFPTNPYPRVDLTFSPEDAATNGNLPFDDLLTGDTSISKSLDTFWVPTLEASQVAFTSPTLVAFTVDAVPACGEFTPEQMVNAATYCPDSNTIAYDDEFMHRLYDAYGDLSFGYPVAAAYSDAVQAAAGGTLTGEPRVLVNDCLVGAYLNSVLPSATPDVDGNQVANDPNQTIILSPGDLDEVVKTAVLFGDVASDTNNLGTAFEKIDSFRKGVIGGLNVCLQGNG